MGKKASALPLSDAQKMSILSTSPLFRGLSESERAYALSLLAAEERHYPRGRFLHRAGEPLTWFGLLLSGAVGVYADDLDGNRVQMAQVAPGETFGESLCYLALPEAPVCILATEESRVLCLRTDALRRPDLDPRVFALRERFVSMLAARTLAMNDRIQILSKTTLREKLTTFFAQCVRKYGSRIFSLPLDRAGLALYLGSNRSALSRELSAMQKEGLLTFYRNSFRLSHASFGCICNKKDDKNEVQ